METALRLGRIRASRQQFILSSLRDLERQIEVHQRRLSRLETLSGPKRRSEEIDLDLERRQIEESKRVLMKHAKKVQAEHRGK